MLCVLFYLGIWLQIKKEPARRIYSYPPAIIERYIELGKIPDRKNSSTPERDLKACFRSYPVSLLTFKMYKKAAFLLSFFRSWNIING